MKLKKLVSAVAGVVMACVFATSAFAATDDQIAAANNYVGQFVSGYTVTDEQIDAVLAKYGTGDAVKAQIESTINKIYNDTENAQQYVNEALEGTGISVTVSGVSIVDGSKVKADVTIDGKTYTATATAAGAPAADGAVDAGTSAGASSVTNSGNVIKATGDASAVVLVAGVLAVAAVLGLAVRKNSSIG